MAISDSSECDDDHTARWRSPRRRVIESKMLRGAAARSGGVEMRRRAIRGRDDSCRFSRVKMVRRRLTNRTAAGWANLSRDATRRRSSASITRSVKRVKTSAIPTIPADVHNSLFFAHPRKIAAQLVAGPGVKIGSARSGRRTIRALDEPQVVGDARRGGRDGRGGNRYRRGRALSRVCARHARAARGRAGRAG
ncbi:MAG: hypothetical protein QOF78_4597 [Phycisphaerales bacterium]|nr:hypothetical protein [Phycisphaerales bacterium]